MKNLIRNSAFALAAAGMAVSVPAAASDFGRGWSSEQSWNHSQDHRDRYGYDTRYYGRSYHSQPEYRADYRDLRTWRGNDGRYYCHRNDGTVGLVIGAAAGALLGHTVDGGYDRTLGTVIGGTIGALLGKSVAQRDSCR